MTSTPDSQNIPEQNPGSVAQGLPEAHQVSREFIEQFTQVQRRLYLFILSQLGDTNEADEALQETNLVIWSKWSEFEPGTNFQAWAYRIATYEVLKSRQRKHRSKLRFSPELMNQIASEANNQPSEMIELQTKALRQCLEKLRPKDRDLIEQRYQPGNQGKDLAAELGRPANSVYQSLGRIRRTLLECIERQLALEFHP